MICDAPKPIDTTEIAEANRELAERSLAISEERLEWSKNVGDRSLAIAENYYTDVTKPTSKFNFDNMVKDREVYDKSFKPAEKQYLDEATKFMRPEYQEQLAAKAGSQTSQAFDAVRRNAERRLAAMGVDPSQGASVQDKTLQIAEASGVSQAMNNARDQARLRGVGYLGDVANFGRGLGSQSIALGQAGVQAGQSGTGAFNAAAGTAGNLSGSPTQWGNMSLAANTGAAGVYNSLNQARQAAHQTPMLDLIGAVGGAAAGAYTGKLTSADGGLMMADGGDVPQAFQTYETGATQVRQPVSSNAFAMDAGAGGVYGAQPQNPNNVLQAPDGGLTLGPGDGSGIDDRIPALVSQGEYVIPADVVRKKGTDFFDKLLEKNHTPAAVQQAMAVGHGANRSPPQPQAIAPMGQAAPMNPAMPVGGMATSGLT